MIVLSISSYMYYKYNNYYIIYDIIVVCDNVDL